MENFSSMSRHNSLWDLRRREKDPFPLHYDNIHTAKSHLIFLSILNAVLRNIFFIFWRCCSIPVWKIFPTAVIIMVCGNRLKSLMSQQDLNKSYFLPMFYNLCMKLCNKSFKLLSVRETRNKIKVLSGKKFI